ncbi:MAG: cyclic pyranopterin monophosphate synthase MoaC [Candidatus Tectomicrobia bacterium]|uniref:Cyclic pyranopterin monophosphate synthase n=1 Tax=Tectimicrobiota bacterium TaxID=2528274 RepID=A0A932CNF6_UNCTE|nr:cyclic pyranopterin monophosphate synthase MoaC [Candidatus Tectomicrobia bacterium]
MADHKLTHIDEEGRARMVDVSSKAETEREAVAQGRILMQPETFRLIQSHQVAKGDALGVARVAGIMAAKQTPTLIPLCHPIQITQVEISFQPLEEERGFEITSRVKCVGKTGVEMEALTALAVAALTIYDMCKAADREMVISEICLVKKRGGKSGEFVRTL